MYSRMFIFRCQSFKAHSHGAICITRSFSLRKTIGKSVTDSDYA